MYSPSLQSIDALCRLHVPIIVLDTTETVSFDSMTDPVEIMYNHGIHGVQDMCNLLLRRGKKFFIEAGHFEQSDVIARVGVGYAGEGDVLEELVPLGEMMGFDVKLI